MNRRHIVIVGAGQAGYQTAVSLRERGFEGDITLVGEEAHPPYQRPPLSKQFLSGTGGVETVLFRHDGYYHDSRIACRFGCGARRIDRSVHTVELMDGTRLVYDDLVLATGSRARMLPGLAPHERILSLRDLVDATRLRGLLATPGDGLVVIGGGFIGMETAAIAREYGHDVTVIEGNSRILGRVLSASVSDYIAARHRAEGVEILDGVAISAVVPQPDMVGVTLSDGRSIAAGHIVVGIGALPNDDLAREAGLTVSNGVVVGSNLASVDDPQISAIGDCAYFPDRRAGSNIRLESVQNAVDQARYLADRLLGRTDDAYDALPWFWTKQYEMSVQIAGLSHGCRETHVIGNPSEGRFSVLRFDDGGHLSCVESVSSPVDHTRARKLLGSGQPPHRKQLAAKGFDLAASLQDRLSEPARART